MGRTARLPDAVDRLGEAGRAALLAEIERMLGGRIRDIFLTDGLRDLYFETSWRQRSGIARSWLGWVSVVSVAVSGLQYVHRQEMVALSLFMLAVVIPVVYAALARIWARPRARWIEGATVPVAISVMMSAGGALGLSGGGHILHDYLGVVLFASTTAIVIFPVTLPWTIVGAVGAVGAYVGFGLFDTALEIKDTLIYAIVFAVITGCLIPARRSMNIVLQHAFLLTLRGLLQSRALESANARLAILARTDALTGLPNRRAFEDVAARLWRWPGEGRPSLGILMLDIDNFKRLNDTAGHAAGDRCLAAVADAIRTHVPDSGMAARYGGEEFICIIAEATPGGLLRLAEALRASVEAMACANPGLGADGIVTVSVGLALSPSDGRLEGLAELIGVADAALYRAKAEGRNRAVAAWIRAAEAGPAPDSARDDKLCA